MDIFKNVQKKKFENTFVMILKKKRKKWSIYYLKTSNSLKKIRELLIFEGKKIPKTPFKKRPQEISVKTYFFYKIW
uniref:Uncharacterized protein n=1 Tax=viral metagenome TaxID=1070528 RepID=A0A6C0ATJ8_9ZZZZ